MVSWRSHISLVDLLRGLINRSNIGLPRAKKDAQCNSILVPGQMSKKSNTNINFKVTKNCKVSRDGRIKTVHKQLRVIGIITYGTQDAFLNTFHRNPVNCLKISCRVHLVCYYPYHLFYSTIPTYFAIFLVALYLVALYQS